MRKNLGKYICEALLLGTALLFSACHGSKQMAEFSVPESFDENKHVEISFWAKNDTNKNQTAVYEKAIKDFEALYPNITVNMKLYTDYSRIYNDVITNIATKTTPNVCITYPDHIATYISGNNNVVSLDELMTDPEYGLGGSKIKFDSPTCDELVPEFLAECKLDEKIYALPYMRSTEACYINKTFVEKLGYTIPDELTWDFVWEVSEAATAKNADGDFLINGQKIMIPFIYKSTDNMMIQMLKQREAGYSDTEGNIGIFNDTTKEFLYTIADHTKTGAFSTFKISSYPANFLNAGQCIFAIDSTAGSTWMGSDAPLLDISADQIVRFETVVRPIPQFDTENPKMISQGPSVCIFNKDDPQVVMASWLFTQYLLTNDVQVGYSMTEGYVPVTIKAQQSEEYLSYIADCGVDNDVHYPVKIAASKLLVENTSNTFVTPVFNGSASLREASGQMIENVAKSIRRKETVDDAYMDKLFNDMVSLYRLDSTRKSGVEVEKDLGALPSTAKALIAAIVAAWIGIAIFYVGSLVKNKNSSR